MILFFDTETSDLPDFNKRASDPTQPHIVQLAAILTDLDGNEIETQTMYVRPAGWRMSPEAIARHGITHEFATLKGVPETEMIRLLWGLIQRAKLMVGHNLQFDKFMARIAARRFGLLTDSLDAWWKAFPCFCTMREMTDVCCLPGPFRNKYKWPKLEEAYFHVTGRKLEGAHDALADVRATREIYFWLLKQNAEVTP